MVGVGAFYFVEVNAYPLIRQSSSLHEICLWCLDNIHTKDQRKVLYDIQDMVRCGRDEEKRKVESSPIRQRRGTKLR